MQEFVTLIGQGGVIGVLAIWLYFERLRAEKLQNERDALLERVLKAQGDNNTGLSELKNGQEETVKAIGGMRDLLTMMRDLMMMGTRE